MNTLPIGLIGDVGGGELMLVAAAILLLFGGKRLPSIARTIGKTVENLRKTSQDFKDQLLKADQSPLDDIINKPAHGTTFDSEGQKASLPESDVNHMASSPSPPEIPPRDLAG